MEVQEWEDKTHAGPKWNYSFGGMLAEKLKQPLAAGRRGRPSPNNERNQRKIKSEGPHKVDRIGQVLGCISSNAIGSELGRKKKAKGGVVGSYQDLLHKGWERVKWSNSFKRVNIVGEKQRVAFFSTMPFASGIKWKPRSEM